MTPGECAPTEGYRRALFGARLRESGCFVRVVLVAPLGYRREVVVLYAMAVTCTDTPTRDTLTQPMTHGDRR